MKLSFFSIAAGLVLALGSLHTQAQTAGSLDATFGTGGKVLFTLPSHSLEARDAAIASDGSIFVLGTAQATDAPEFRPIVAKFTAAGALDASFGPGGYVMLPLSLDYHGRALVIAPDGSLRIGGQNQVSFVVTALTSTGSLLTSFGTGGMASIIVGPRAEVRDMGIQSTGALVLAGHADWIDTLGVASTRTALYLARFTSAGVADTTFGTAGVVSYIPATGSQSASCLQVLPDDKLLVGGDNGTAANAIGFLARFTATAGTLDTTFDTDGIWTNAATGAIVALTTESSGRITLLGKAIGGQGITMARMSSSAVLDTTFSADGLASFTATETPGALALRSSDARIFIAGAYSNAGTTAYSLRRVQPDGANDANFNAGSPVLTTMGSNFSDTVSNLIRLDDGKLLTIGHTRVATTNMTLSFGLARYNPGADETNVAPPTITTQPANQTVALDSTATFTVVHTGPAATYQWFKNGNPITTTATTSLFVSTSNLGAEGSYSVKITNAYGSITSNAATLTINGAPIISSDLDNIDGTIDQGTQQTISVRGRLPLTFTWKKGSTVVDTEVVTNSPDSHIVHGISFEGLVSENGVYTCTVSNAEGSDTSNPFTVTFRAVKSLIFEPADTLVSVGSPLQIKTYLDVTLTPYQYEWKKDGKLIPNAVGNFAVNHASLADGGSYACRVGTLAGIITSGTARVAVVESDPRAVSAAAGKVATITAITSGPGLSYHWYFGTTQLNNGGRISGADKATLSITGSAALTDSGVYTCLVTSAWGQSISTGDITLVVESDKPVVDPITFVHGRVGLPYSAIVSATHTPQKFTATGLPPGLVCNAAGEITGTPTAPGTFSVKITAANPVGSSPVLTAPLIIDPLAVQGVYAGIVSGQTGYIGTFTMTVAVNGSYTGKAIVGFSDGILYTLPFTGVFTSSIDSPDAYDSTSNLIPVPPVFTDGPYLVIMTQHEGTGGLNARLVAGSSSSSLEYAIYTYRNPWHATLNPATAFAGYHTCRLATVYGGDASGDGYAWITSTTAGTCSMAGKLPDNTAFTMSGFINDIGDSWFFQWLYGNKGKLAGTWGFALGTGPLYTDTGVSGTLKWTRPPLSTIPAGSIDHPYATGFDDSTINMTGARYMRPGSPGTTTAIMLDANATTDNITATVSGGHLAYNFYTGESIEAASLSTVGTLRTNHTAVFPPFFPGDETSPPDAIKFNSLAFNPATGIYSGTATAYQQIDVQLPSGDFQTRIFYAPVSFQGIATRSEAASPTGFGTGFFNYSVPFGLYDVDGNLIRKVNILLSGDSTISLNTF